jgi:hypothetical protein
MEELQLYQSQFQSIEELQLYQSQFQSIEELQLYQLPVIETIIKFLDSVSINVLGRINKKIWNLKNQCITEIVILSDNFDSSQICKYPNLERVHLKNLNMMYSLNQYPKIKKLKLSNYLFFNNIKNNIDFFNNIEELDLTDSFFLDYCFKYLKLIPNLKYLNISGYKTFRYEQILTHILTLPNLKTLIMQNIPNKLPITPFKEYLPNSKISHIDLTGCHFQSDCKSEIKDYFIRYQDIQVLI